MTSCATISFSVLTLCSTVLAYLNQCHSICWGERNFQSNFCTFMHFAVNSRVVKQGVSMLIEFSISFKITKIHVDFCAIHITILLCLSIYNTLSTIYCTHNDLLPHGRKATPLKERIKQRNIFLYQRVSGNIHVFYRKRRNVRGERYRRKEKMKRTLKLCVLI